MFDTDKFIECVHGIPALWDKSAAEYSDKIIRDRAWIEIGIVMYEDWNCATLRERDDRVKEMKNKWRHIRDHFFRVLNKGKSGDAAPSKRKKYLYADSLSFLMNYETKRPTSGNIAANEDENIDEPQESQVLEEAEEITQVPVRPDINTRQDALKQKKLSPFQSQLLMKLDTSSAKEEDVDSLYLLSMLSDYKGLTDTQKLDFKMMNLQFFRNVKSMPQYQTLPMMPPPNSQPQSTVVMPPFNRQSRTLPMIPPSKQYYLPQTSFQYQQPNTAQPMVQQMQQTQTPLLMHQYDETGGSQHNSAASPTSVNPSPTDSMHSDYSY